MKGTGMSELSARRKWTILGVVVVGGVIVDQITKYIAHAELRGRGLVTLIDGFLELHYVRNPGAFFSLGADLDPNLRRVIFVVASSAASVLIVRLYLKATAEQNILRWALVFLLGGALGNLIDRLLYGEVIDFVHLYWEGVFDWATFNVADVLISAGLVLLAADLIRPARRARDPEPAAATSESPESDETKRALSPESTP